MGYAVKELFYTLQGEGSHSGRAAVFCRFAGCNLWTGRESDRARAECRFCDTDFIGTDGPGGGKFSHADALADAILACWNHGATSHPERRFVVLTGGEPLLQVDSALCRSLHARGFYIAVETNGTQPLPSGPTEDRIDWVCMSPKAGTTLVLHGGDELKLVFPQPGAEPDLRALEIGDPALPRGAALQLRGRDVGPGRQCRAGLAIVYLKMAFRPDLSDAGPPDSASWLRHRRMRVGEPAAAPDGSPSRILIRDTWSSEILPALAPEPGDIVLYKHRFSGFHETGLDGLLRSRGIRTLVFTGCTTSICVESTLRDAMFRDYRCLLLEDCAAEPIGDGLPRSNHEASVLTVEVLLGWVSRSDVLIAALQGAGAAT